MARSADQARVLHPDRPPAWHPGRSVTIEEVEARFTHERGLTVGLEEELGLVDPATYAEVGAIDRVLELTGGDALFTRELQDTQVEIVTPVSGNAVAAGLHLARARIDLARSIGAEVLPVAAGTYPHLGTAGEIGAGRYRQIAQEYTVAAAGRLPCGQHVHVGVDGAERALYVYNRARAYLPEISALAANSPFLGGVDVQLASARRSLNDAFHRSGVPPAFGTWADLLAFVDWGRRGGLFPDASHFWWELRLHLGLGTLEFRAADTQTRAEDALAVGVVCQSLVAWLSASYDEGRPLPVHETVRIEENAWRAMRYGVRGYMVDLEDGEQVSTRDRLGGLLDRLEPYASRLGGEAGLHTARALLIDNGAERQRAVAAREGTQGLVAWLARETVASADELLRRQA
jgi:carboxylate-amine ligase